MVYTKVEQNELFDPNPYKKKKRIENGIKMVVQRGGKMSWKTTVDALI